MRFQKGSLKQEYLEADSRYINTLKDARLENMFAKNGKIFTRKGLQVLDSGVFFSPFEFSDYAEFKMTDIYIPIDDKKARIAVCIEDDSKSNIYYHMIAVFADGTKRNLGSINFARTDFDEFYTPASFLIYTGASTRGSGIYMFFRTVCEGKPDSHRIYELSESMTEWLYIMNSDIYTPTVLMNGKGDSRDSADSELRFLSPTKLEPMNLLDTRFHCYYTSDGVSYSFTLPVSLNSSLIRCRLNTAPDTSLEWIIPEGESVSTPVQVGESSVLMYCNRKSGKFVFQIEGGQVYPIPYFNMENNLLFTADREDGSSINEVCSMKISTAVSSSVETGTSAVTLFSGSSLSPDKIIWINPENPLYFPESASLCLTEKYGTFDNLFSVSSRVFALSKSRIYSAKITAQTPYDLKGIIKGIENSGKVNFATVLFDWNTELPCEIQPKTASSTGNSILFCGKNGKIYECSSPLKITEIADWDKEKENPDFALFLNGSYMMFVQNNIILYTPELYNTFGLLRWTFPIKFISAMQSVGTIIFFAQKEDDSVYLLELSGEADNYLSGSRKLSENIHSSLSFSLYDKGLPCRLGEISIKTSLKKPCRAELLDGDKIISDFYIFSDKVRVPNSLAFELLSVKFHFDGCSEFGNIKVLYRKLKKL